MYEFIYGIVYKAMTMIPYHYIMTRLEAEVKDATEKLPRHYALRIFLRNDRCVDKIYIPGSSYGNRDSQR